MRSPRSARNASSGAGIAPYSERRCTRAAASSSDAVIAAPMSTSLWPEMYFVAECTTTSAPSSSGRCSSGVANVLSTATIAPCACAARAIAAMSATSSAGLVGDSNHTIAASAHASATAAVSVMSTNTAFARPCSSRSASAATVPVYECRGATIVPPGSTRSNTAAMAAMPDANDTQRPPSSAPRVSSNAVHDGFP